MSNSDVTHAHHVNLQLRPQPATTPSPTAPNRLFCPLTSKPLTDPVVAPNGLTYNADAIYPYLEEHGHLPTDNQPVTPSKLWPDQNRRDRLSPNPPGDKDQHLKDPITFETTTHPVVASDGRTYNQSTLERLFRQNNGISPFSRDKLATTGYRNQTLMTELAAQVKQAPNAALATEPTRNLVTFEPPPETDDPPPQPPPHQPVKVVAALAITAGVSIVLAIPFIFPTVVAAGIIAAVSTGVIAGIAYWAS